MKIRIRPFPGNAGGVVLLLAALWLAAAPCVTASPAVVLNEIQYHPVELSSFDAEGAPLLDLSDDVHEFLELYNAGTTNVSLKGWRISGDVEFEFATNATIGAGRYLVIGRNPSRLAAISQYALVATNVLGPFRGNLSNRNGTVRLRDAFDNTVDSVSYSAEFPWAIGADALGADDEWTGLSSTNFQYRGRSLERVSATWGPNDPANWLASPAPGNPTPGRVNTVTRPVPKPVVTSLAVYQDSTGSPIIRANQAVRIDCIFSAVTSLSGIIVEYFIDDINVTTETRLTATMNPAATGESAFTVLLPGRGDRSVVRYRIRANRGTGLETVSPRADDPFAWHAYFVTPNRNSTNRIYDCFISSASLNTLATNLNPALPSSVEFSVLRRISLPDPPGLPSVTWNATQPAILVADGVVYDARARYHGSQYRRTPGNNSWKWQFPRYQKLDNRGGIFISDNDDITVACGRLYRLAGVPQSYTRWIDFYLNATPGVRRMDQDEMDDDLMARFTAEQRIASPELPNESSGEFYKSQGNFLFSDPTGPFGYGGYRMLTPRPPYWTQLKRYEHTYGLQMNGWKGHRPFMDMLHGLWAARGDSPSAPNPNIQNLRAYLSSNFDLDTTLTSMAIRAWSGGWDNFNHNHFTWRRENGKWAILQWDFDGELDVGTTNASIYLSEYGVPLINTQFGVPIIVGGPPWVDANWLNDSFFKAFREEYKRKLFLLNNTILNPTNITAIGLGSYRTYADGRFSSVNRQLALGTFFRPRIPTNISPGRFEAVLSPAQLVSSPYSHAAPVAPAHRSTTWSIRSTNGNYDAPIFKTATTASSNLTSLPIPFDRLTFGQTYFWKCVHTDTNGYPSPDSAETAFVYGAQPSFAPVIAIDADTMWRFNTNGVAPPTDWRERAFNDSGWSEGAPLIGDDGEPLVEPIRTPIARGNRLVTYFRKSFSFDGNPADTYLRLRHVVDDGIVVWLNGVEIHRWGVGGTPGSLVGNATPANRGVVNAVYEGPFFAPSTALVPGFNVIAATVHRSSTVSPDVLFGLSVDVAVPPQPGSVVINEILADNRSAAVNGTGNPDYIELFNNTDTVQNLSGLSLSDNVQRPGKYIFPAGTTIPAHGQLVIWCDSETNAPGLHSGFALDNDGQTVALFTIRTNGYLLADSFTFGLQVPDFAIGRSVDGTGSWELAVPTPGGSHQAATVGTPTPLKINEWMASDASGPDWIELYNPSTLPVNLSGLGVTDNRAMPTKSILASMSFIAPGGFRQLIADEDPGASARHVNFKLSAGGETIALYDTGRNLIDSIDFGPQVSGVSEGHLPDGTDTRVFFSSTASPEDPNYLPVETVAINEVLSHSDLPFEDAVELVNLTDNLVDLSNWWLSDDRLQPRKYRLPEGTAIGPRGYLVLYENQFNPNPGAPESFAFSSARGDEVYLSEGTADGSTTGLRTSATFDPSESGVSLGRFSTSLGEHFVALSRHTFGVDNPGTVDQFRTGAGAENAYAAVGPVIISEIQYHPPDLAPGVDNDQDEFIELRNTTTAPVPLFRPEAPANTWRVRDAVSFTFPQGITLAGNESVLIVGFDPITDTNALAGFREAYGPSSTRIFGPWDGKLDNSSDSVELVKPGATVTEPGRDFGYVPSILVDKVHYNDGFPWPEGADGDGFSLMRSAPNLYGDDPANWLAWYPTPGRDNLLNQPPVITVVSPTDGAIIPGPANVLISANVTDPDGTVQFVDFFDGTNRLTRLTGPPYEFNLLNASFGPHTLSVQARDNGYAAIRTQLEILIASQPPVVTLLTPANNALIANGTTVALAANATDSDTPISRVEFRVDGAKVGEDATPPYSATWVATPGVHTITATAIDSSSTTGTSAPADVSVQIVATAESIAIEAGSSWRYFDGGTSPGATWATPGFVDAAWSTGFAELGFGDGDEFTLLRPSIGGVGSITFYFRQQFTLNSVADISSARLSLLRDDGAVVYLNGVEVARQNMPAGTIINGTFASTAISVPDEFTFFPADINPARFVAGQNVLAVEVHQSSTASTDVSFDAELLITRASYGPGITSPPLSRSVNPGEDVAFSVTATGTGTLFYQWFYNDAPLAGQNSATLFLPSVQVQQAGNYTVTISNAIASITSRPATLAVVQTGLDSDHDGIPDEWELQYGLNHLDPSDRDRDPDGDRMGNWAEYMAGTNPTDSRSVLKFTAITRGPGSVLTFTASANTTYTVQYKNQLGALPWLNLVDVPARSTNRTAVVVDPSFGASRFFRLSTPQAPPTAARILSVAPARTTTLMFNAVSNRTYLIQYNDASVWRSLEEVPARPTNHTAVVYDPTPASSRVYRLLLP